MAVWELAVVLGGVDPFFLPPPHTVILAFLETLRSGELLANTGWSLLRIVIGYALAALFGTALGVAMGWFRMLDDFLDPLVEFARPIPPIALIPLFILWLGIGDTQKVAIIFVATVFPIFVSTYFGVRSTQLVLIRAARTLGSKGNSIIPKVIIPSALPSIISGLRVSLAIGFIVIVAAEMVAARNGLGFMIIDAERLYKTDVMFVGIITISVLGFAFDRLARYVRSIVIPWYQEI